ncbi:MAG: endonuclease III [Rickettsiales bacterium]|nr:endonuclease III [Rickettsiales bacterium]
MPKKLTKKDIDAIFERLSESNPEPETELEAPNPFCLLVAIVLSAQATDVGVNKATPPLFAQADTPEKMIAIGEERIREHIKTIGLFNSKAKNVYALSQKLVNEFGSKIPQERELLETLPGVGRKTANVWLNCVLGKHTIAVDTHVFRVANRTGMVNAKNVLETELQLEKRIPERWMQHAHHWLILHGRYTCKARKPRCNICIIEPWCNFGEKTEES